MTCSYVVTTHVHWTLSQHAQAHSKVGCISLQLQCRTIVNYSTVSCIYIIYIYI